MIFLTDILKPIVEQKVSSVVGYPVYFQAGRYREITQLLTEKEGGTNQKLTKFPLVWLVMDYTERIDKFSTTATNLRLFIVAETEDMATSMERIDNVFKPKLSVIYEAFLKQLALSGRFNILAWDGIEHDRILCPYWGTEVRGSNDAALFNDIVDAIEIRNLNLQINKIC